MTADGFTWSVAAVAAFSFVAWAAMRFAPAVFGFLARRWLGIDPFARAIVLVVVSAAVAEAQKATNGVHGTLSVPRIVRSASSVGVPSVTPEEIARGYRLVGIEPNVDCSYAMPEGTELKHGWWVHGAYDDCFDLDFGDWRFPIGTDDLASACIFTWGKMRPSRKDRAREIDAIGCARCAAVPHRSRFWSGLSPSNTMLLTWENFAMNRDTNTPVNAQVELWPCGDFVTRSNGVARAYRRVEPFDWDDDGIVNSVDSRPFASDGDCHGSANELPPGNASNQYYFVDLVVEGAAAEVEFFGDGPSDYPDPHFAARAGETNRVMLLIGKGYWVESSRPIRCVGTSDARIEVCQETSDALSVCWPVSFQHTPVPTSTVLNSFTMSVTPSWLGGAFVWDTNCCCGVTGGVGCYSFACPVDRDCGCHGCTASGAYTYAGYSIDVRGGRCGCEWRREAGATVRFSPHAIIYEEAYANAPGEIVERKSTTAELSVDAYGGMYGGTVEVSLEGGGRLSGDVSAFPIHRKLAEGEVFSCTFGYAANSACQQENDVVVRSVFTDAFTGVSRTNETTLTVVRVELRAEYVAPGNPMQGRHVYGVGERVWFRARPATDSVRVRVVRRDEYDPTAYDAFEDGATEVGLSGDRVYTCPIADVGPTLSVVCAGCAYVPEMTLVEPQEVVTRGAAWGENDVDFFYQGNRKCWPSGTVGEACLVTTNYIGPMHVSFQGIAVSEVPCFSEDVVTGCFTNGHSRTHTQDAGAGVAHYIQAGNFWFVDAARSRRPTTDWSPGSTLVWKIPVGWHRKTSESGDWQGANACDYEIMGDGKTRPLLVGNCEDLYMQSRHIDEGGTFRSEKFGHWISRSPSCRVVLDGVVLQRIHPWGD